MSKSLAKIAKAVTFLRSPKAFTGYCVWVSQVISDLSKLSEEHVTICSHPHPPGRYRPAQVNRSRKYTMNKVNTGLSEVVEYPDSNDL
jgi:hypothetical protein